MATNYDSTTGLPPCGWAPRGYRGEVHRNQPPTKPVQHSDEERAEWAANRARDRRVERRKRRFHDVVQKLRYVGTAAEIERLTQARDRMIEDGRMDGQLLDCNDVPYSDGSGYGP